MGFFDFLFGGGASNNFDAIEFVKKTTGYSCNQSYINLNELQQQGAIHALQLDRNLPRIMNRSPLTMVGELKYLLNVYEAVGETEAMRKVIHAVLVFLNQNRAKLPSHTSLFFLCDIPTDLLHKVSRECGLDLL